MALGYFEGYDNTIYQLDRKEHGIFIDDRCASEYKLINPDGVSHDSDKLWKVFDFLYNPTEMNTPFSKEFAINKIPLEVEVPKIFSKFLSFKISELIKVISSNREYKLLSIELNKLPKIVFIVSIIICVIFVCSKIPPN